MRAFSFLLPISLYRGIIILIGGDTMRETKDLVLRLPPDLWKKASYNKIETGESITALITRLLEEYFLNNPVKTFQK